MQTAHHTSKLPGVILVITVIILAGALIGIFFPKGVIKTSSAVPPVLRGMPVSAGPSYPNDFRSTDAYYQKENGDTSSCGIKVFSPLPGQPVMFPLEVSGYVNGCGWVPFDNGQAVTLEIRDMNGPISPVIIIPVQDPNSFTLPAYFKSNINITKIPTSPNGVFIFHNSAGDSFQIPVFF